MNKLKGPSMPLCKSMHEADRYLYVNAESGRVMWADVVFKCSLPQKKKIELLWCDFFACPLRPKYSRAVLRVPGKFAGKRGAEHGK